MFCQEVPAGFNALSAEDLHGADAHDSAVYPPDTQQAVQHGGGGANGLVRSGIAHQLEAAKGDYLFFVDSDDTIAPESLSVLSAAIDRSHAEIYSFQMISHDGSGHLQPMDISACYDEPFSLAQKPAFLLSLPAAWARIWKRSLFLDTGIRYPSRVWYEDIRTSTKLFAAAASIEVLPDRLYWYLARPGSIMRSGNLTRNREILDAFDDILSWFDAHGLRSQYETELCRLAVDHIQLAAAVRVARMDPKSTLLQEFQSYMAKNFPNARSNPYLSQLPGLHKLLLKLIGWKCYGLIRLLFRLKDKE